MSQRVFVFVLSMFLFSACGETEEPSADVGRALASSPDLSRSAFNVLACTDCHATGNDERILPGYPLAGAFHRPSFWGGAIPDLKGAVDFCLVYFMKGDPLDSDDPDGRSLYRYLASIGEKGPTEPLPFTVVSRIATRPAPGDRDRGAEVHRLACEGCHGAAGTGAGKSVSDAPILPDQARAEAEKLFPTFDPALVFVEKVRHGRFFSVGGTMPLYSLEALSDGDLGALLAFYEL